MFNKTEIEKFVCVTHTEGKKHMTTERKMLAENNINLARYVANQYRNTGMEQEELVSIAFLGLVKAAATFNEERASFATYAVPTIRNEILMCLRKKEVSTVSMDAPVADGIAIVDTLGCCSEELDALENSMFLSQSMKLLNPKEQTVLQAIYYQNKVQSEVAKHLGYSQAHVSRIHHAAISKLRRACLK